MSRILYRYRFSSQVPPGDAEETLLLGVLAAEGMVGASRLRLEFRYAFDRERRVCVIDATAPAGEIVARVFTSILTHVHGPDAFGLERLLVGREHACGEVCA